MTSGTPEPGAAALARAGAGLSYFIPENVRDWRIFFWGMFIAQFTRGLLDFDAGRMLVSALVFAATLAAISVVVRIRRYRVRIEKRPESQP